MRKLKITDSNNNSTASKDLLFNLLLGFAALFVIAFLLINPPQNKKIDPKAEVMIILTWPDGNYDDVDLWLKLPGEEKYVGYRSKDREYVHLERDDLGITNDTVTNAEGKVLVNNINREVIVFRQFVEGHYILNVHYYADRAVAPNSGIPQETAPAPIPCKITIVKLNPTYKELGNYEVVLRLVKDEKTVVQFDIEGEELKNFSTEQTMFVNANETSAGAAFGAGTYGWGTGSAGP